MSNALYDQDFHAWAMRQAALLRERKLADADTDNIAEEIETLARGEHRKLEKRLKILLTHLLKWRFQPALRGNVWRLTIKQQRQRTSRHLRDNPSLKANLDQAIDDAYGAVAIRARRETGQDQFPPVCRFTFNQIIDDTFWPND